MKSIFRVMALLAIVGLVSTVEAKTTKYEITDMGSSMGWTNYPGLDVSQPTSAILTISRTPPVIEPKIVSLEVSFPKAAKLLATNFKKIEGTEKYRALVPGVWVYKEIIVDINNFQVDGMFNAEIFISERTAFINPVAEQQTGPMIIRLSGILTDASPTRIVDQEILTVSAKKLTLSLKDRLVYSHHGGIYGFAIDALWYGKGTKTLIIPAPVPRDLLDTADPIALIVDGNFNDPMISVKFKDFNGYEVQSYSVRLREVLDHAFGPTQWPPM